MMKDLETPTTSKHKMWPAVASYFPEMLIEALTAKRYDTERLLTVHIFELLNAQVRFAEGTGKEGSQMCHEKKFGLKLMLPALNSRLFILAQGDL